MKTQGRAQAWSLGTSYGGTKLLPVKDMDGSFCPETISFPGCPDNSLFECPFLNKYLFISHGPSWSKNPKGPATSFCPRRVSPVLYTGHTAPVRAVRE